MRFTHRIMAFVAAVLLAVGSASAVTYEQDFTGYLDGQVVLGDGTTIFSNTLTGISPTASVQGEALRLTSDDTGGTSASFHIPKIAGSARGWTATFDVQLSDAPGESNPADGFSFNYGNIPVTGGSEEGHGGVDHISYEFDTWDNGGGENGFNIARNGVDLPGGFIPFPVLNDGQTTNAKVRLVYNPLDGVSMFIDDGGGELQVFGGLDAVGEGFNPNDAYTFGFSARTGGADETVILDNVKIEAAPLPRSYHQDFETLPEGSPLVNGATNLRDGSAIASTTQTNGQSTASVQDGMLRLTADETGSTNSSYRIPALENSSKGWTAMFDFVIEDAPGGNPPADGFSFNYGDIPATGFGTEEGFGAGVDHLSFEFDTWNNGTGEAGFNIAVNDQDQAATSVTWLPDGGSIEGSAMLIYDDLLGASMFIDFGDGNGLQQVFSNVALNNFNPTDAYTFAFSARTGGATELFAIDNLSITAAGVPEPATGLLGLLGVAALGLRRRRQAA